MAIQYATFKECMATVRRCKMKSKRPIFTRYDLETDHIETTVRRYDTIDTEIFKLTLYKD
jgi:hypothetical protein